MSFAGTGTRTGVSALHGLHQVPGFAVGFVDSAGAAFGVQRETGGGVANGEDEIGVVGNDVDDYEIHFGGFVGDHASAGVPGRANVVEAVDQAGGAFYLHAPKFVAFGPVAADEDEVEAFAVAVGLGDSKAFGGGFVGEGKFGEFSAALGVELALAGSLRVRRWGAPAGRAGFWH
jgi:hypothetical protein